MNRMLIGITSALVLVSTATFAGPLKGHPNLKAAHNMVKNAIAKVEAAQTANEFDMNGHAQKAKELLAECEHELAQAAEAATANRK